MINVKVNILFLCQSVLQINKISFSFRFFQSNIYFLFLGQLHNRICSHETEVSFFLWIFQIDNADENNTVRPTALQCVLSDIEMSGWFELLLFSSFCLINRLWWERPLWWINLFVICIKQTVFEANSRISCFEVNSNIIIFVSGSEIKMSAFSDNI